jgi:hypothetical protein
MTGSTLTPSTEREAAFVQTKQILSMPNSPISGSADILLTFLE